MSNWLRMQLRGWTFVVVLALIPIPEGAGSPIIDQQQPIIDVSVGANVIGGGSEQKLAQVVTAGLSGLHTEVRFPIAGVSGTLLLEIQGVTAGKPSGVVLTSEDFLASTFPSSFLSPPPSLESLVFDKPLALSAGQVFAIVLSSTGQFAALQGPVGDSYPGGNAFFDARPNPPGWVCARTTTSTGRGATRITRRSGRWGRNG